MSILVVVLFALLPVINWPVAAILMRASLRRPAIRSLSERAVLAFLIALVTTVYSVIVINSTDGYPVLDRDTAQTVIRLFFLCLGLYPLWWLWSYWSGRFGG